MDAPAPRPAATLVLCRPTSAGAFEVLLVKRHGKSGFMAGAHVFPGGRVDDDDVGAGAPYAAWAAGIVDACTAAQAGAFVAAAVRETNEEAGIDVDPRSLAPWSWWITPKEEPKRFDTRFFLAPVAADTVERIDDHEAVASAWLTPAGALAAYARGDIVLAPPTLATLEDLAPFSSFAEAAASVQRPLRAVCPRIVVDDAGAMVLALPGDALHEERICVFARRTRFVQIVQIDGGARFASAQGG